MATVLDSFSPEEIVLAAALFAFTIASDHSDADATLIAFFLSTISSDLGLLIDKRARERAAQEPSPTVEVPHVR
jgi:hypothetical protein